MSQKLKEIHARLKGIANQQLVHDAALHECINQLEDEINQMPQTQSAASYDPPEGGNSPSGTPDLP